MTNFHHAVCSPAVESNGGERTVAVDFRRSLPPIVPSLHARLLHAFERLHRHQDLARLLHGGVAHGAWQARAAAARFVAPRLGEAVDPERVMLTNGTQSALLLLLPHLVGRGGKLLAERLSYGALRSIAQAAGVGLIGLDIDEDGLLPDAFERACRNGDARALYCNPTVQNPTTAIMPHERRLALADIARRYGVPIIEDDALGRLHPDAVMPIARLAPDVCWYVMSASKALAHGMRFACLVAPSAQARNSLLGSAEQLSHWTAAPLLSALVSDWVDSGDADRVSAEIRAENHAREAFARANLGRFGLISKPGSMHVWLPLSAVQARGDFVARAAATGILLRGAALFAVDAQPAPKAVRLSLSTPATRADAEDGILRLCALLDATE